MSSVSSSVITSPNVPVVPDSQPSSGARDASQDVSAPLTQKTKEDEEEDEDKSLWADDSRSSLLLTLVKEQLANGKGTDIGLKKEAWTSILKSMNASLSLKKKSVTEKQIKNRYQSVRYVFYTRMKLREI